ncbi:MAG TPA: DUF2877 domain-containing protein [Chloroflexia bacterium]|nr:DUF2877 domain-containing protein [Chloroflexia bacterium]
MLAVLHNALYLESSGGYVVCLLGPHGEDGPLSIRVSELDALLAWARDAPGAVFHADRAGITFSDGARVNWAGAPVWQPPPVPPPGAPNQLTEAAAVLAALLQAQPAVEYHRADARIATHLAAFRIAWMSANEVAAVGALTGLLGLGPGLTPSGDDVVAGLMAMLVWRGTTADEGIAVAPLVAAVRAEALERTNHISARLLWHAGDGCLYAPAMALGHALLAGRPDAVPPAAARLLTIGATSGADMALGLLTGAGLLGDREAVPQAHA